MSLETEAPTMASASQAALSRLESMSGDPGGAPETPPAQTPETPGTPETPETPPPAETPPAEQGWKAPEFWEEEFDGQRHRLTPQEVSYMLRNYHAAAKRAAQMARERDGQAPAEGQPAQGGQPQNPLEARLAKLEKMLHGVSGEMEQRAEAERQQAIERDSRAAVEKDPILSKIKSPKMRERVVGYTMLEQMYNPSLSFAEAAKRVAADLDEEFRNVRGGYVADKVESAKHPVEGAGTTTVPSKRLGAADLKNGNVMKRAAQRIERLLSQ